MKLSPNPRATSVETIVLVWSTSSTGAALVGLGSFGQLKNGLRALASQSRQYPLVHKIDIYRAMLACLNNSSSQQPGGGAGSWHVPDLGWWFSGYNQILGTFAAKLVDGCLAGLAWPPLSSEDELDLSNSYTSQATPPEAVQTLRRLLHSLYIPEVKRFEGLGASRQLQAVLQRIDPSIRSAAVAAEVKMYLGRAAQGDRKSLKTLAHKLIHSKLSELRARLKAAQLEEVYGRRSAKDLVDRCTRSLKGRGFQAPASRVVHKRKPSSSQPAVNAWEARKLAREAEKKRSRDGVPSFLAPPQPAGVVVTKESDEAWLQRRSEDNLLSDVNELLSKARARRKAIDAALFT